LATPMEYFRELPGTHHRSCCVVRCDARGADRQARRTVDPVEHAVLLIGLYELASASTCRTAS